MKTTKTTTMAPSPSVFTQRGFFPVASSRCRRGWAGSKESGRAIIPGHIS